MSKILLPNELPTIAPVCCFLYGQPGVGKTTFAISSDKPILLDIEHGLHRVAKQFQSPSIQVESWSDIIDFIDSDDINMFNSIVIDTFGSLIDLCFENLCVHNPKLKSASGTPTQSGWGFIKNEILRLHKKLISTNKNIIYVAHDKESGIDENQKIRPDAAGSSYRDIIKQVDIVGYVSMRGNKRTVCFTPTDEFIAKNSIGLSGYMEIPNSNNNNAFSLILNDIRAKRERENEEREKYDKLLAEQDKKLMSITSMDDLYSLMNSLKDEQEIWGSKTIMWCKIQELALNKFNRVYDNVSKQFKENTNNA